MDNIRASAMKITQRLFCGFILGGQVGKVKNKFFGHSGAPHYKRL
jgi:hypothetical protein